MRFKKFELCLVIFFYLFILIKCEKDISSTKTDLNEDKTNNLKMSSKYLQDQNANKTSPMNDQKKINLLYSQIHVSKDPLKTYLNVSHLNMKTTTIKFSLLKK